MENQVLNSVMFCIFVFSFFLLIACTVRDQGGAAEQFIDDNVVIATTATTAEPPTPEESEYAWYTILNIFALDPRAAFMTYEIYTASFIYVVADHSGDTLAFGEVPEVVVADALQKLLGE